MGVCYERLEGCGCQMKNEFGVAYIFFVSFFLENSVVCS